MRRFLIIFVIVCSLSVSLLAQSNKDKIHITTIQEYNGPSSYSKFGRKALGIINEKLQFFKNISFVERNLNKIMKELKLSQTGLLENQIEIGKFVNADYMLTVKVNVNHISKDFGVNYYNFSIEGKWADIKTAELKQIVVDGEFSDADDEDAHPFKLATTNFAYKVIDIIIENLNLNEADLRNFIEDEEEMYGSIRFKGYRNSIFWLLSAAASGWYGNKLQKDGKKWYAYGSLYTVSGALAYSSWDAFSVTRKNLAEMEKRIKHHKAMYAKKFGREY